MDIVLHKNQFPSTLKSILLFGLLFNGIGLPIDKLILFVFLVLIIFVNIDRMAIGIYELILLLLWFLTAFFSSILNLTFNPMIFYPIVGIYFIITLLKIEWLEEFHQVLFLYIFFSFCFGISAYLFGPNITVTSKGIPFILLFKGFTSTVQSFGTLCILWLVINFERKDNKIYGFQFFVVLLSLVLTFNRSSYLFLFIIFALYNKKIFFFLLTMVLAIVLIFWEQVTSFLFNMSSLQSREELLQGFYLSFWNENTFWGYLFGAGNNYYPEEIMKYVKWKQRPDIENGYAMLLHAYGFLGLFLYLFVSLVILVFASLYRNCYKLGIVLFIYFFMTQYFTQEFVTNIFYLFVASILTLINKNNNNENSSN